MAAQTARRKRGRHPAVTVESTFLVPSEERQAQQRRLLGDAESELCRLDIDWIEPVSHAIPDVLGRPSRPYRTLGILGLLELRGSITARDRKAGEQFQQDFSISQFETLRAAPMVRIGHAVPVFSARQASARQAIRRAIHAVGGNSSIAASVVWAVVGQERSIGDWCRGRLIVGETWDARTVRGILIGALAGLTVHYGY